MMHRTVISAELALKAVEMIRTERRELEEILNEITFFSGESPSDESIQSVTGSLSSVDDMIMR